MQLWFQVVQLLLRASRLGPEYGISLDDIPIHWVEGLVSSRRSLEFSCIAASAVGPGKWSGTYKGKRPYDEKWRKPVQCSAELKVVRDCLIDKIRGLQRVRYDERRL